MLSRNNAVVIGMVFSLVITSQVFAASGKGGGSTTQTVDADKAAKDAQKQADKTAKEAAKAAEKSTKAAEKATKDAAKSQDRIELIAKMKAAEVNDVDAPEDEASLKFRSRGGIIKLTAEIEGFSDGDIFSMYVVAEGKEILVSNLELIDDGSIPRQEVEFDSATWPAGLPMVLTVGMVVRVISSEGTLVLEGSLQNK